MDAVHIASMPGPGQLHPARTVPARSRARKNYDYSQHCGHAGNDSAYLYSEILRVRQILRPNEYTDADLNGGGVFWHALVYPGHYQNLCSGNNTPMPTSWKITQGVFAGIGVVALSLATLGAADFISIGSTGLAIVSEDPQEAEKPRWR